MEKPVYKSLDPARVLETLEHLRERIDERFPGSSLHALAESLVDTSRAAEARAVWLARPIYWLRGVTWFLSAVAVGGGLVAVGLFFARLHVKSWADAVTILEAAANLLVFLGVAVLFLWSAETRQKRKNALLAIHELRSVVHIIDMHQLTKDPERLLSPQHQTALSPKLNMTRFELRRYLDYCCELLSLTGKIAAVYAEQFGDPVALAEVNEVEQLATGLSRKIWQKIMVLHSFETSELEPRPLITS